jgi:hypothetical protein
MKLLFPCLIAIAFCSPLLRADDQIPALIKQLGDDSPKIREEASLKLRQLGKEALPALEQAAKSKDPEVAARAHAISRQIDEDLHPRPRFNDFDDNNDIPAPRFFRANPNFPGGGNFRIRIQTNLNPNQVGREITAVENGKIVTIKESAEEISVSTTQNIEGRQVTKIVTAKSKDALKKEDPDACAMYEKYTQPGPMRLPSGLSDLRIQPLNTGDQAALDNAMKNLLEQHRKLTEERRKLIEQQMRELRQRLDEQE